MINKKTEKEFLEDLLKYIPMSCRTLDEAEYTYSNLRLMIQWRLNDEQTKN